MRVLPTRTHEAMTHDASERNAPKLPGYLFLPASTRNGVNVAYKTLRY